MSDSDYRTERATNIDLRDDQTDERRETGLSHTDSNDTERNDTERNDTDTDRNAIDGNAVGRNDTERDHSDGSARVDEPSPRGPSGGLVSDPESLRRRWESVQVGFVDDPRQAVRDADGLVSSVIEDLADGFRRQRQRLESHWSDGGEASTDDLRESFHRYRDFFERLLEV